MDLSFVMVYANILVGAAGFTIYGLWAGKWLHRRAVGLFLLNAVASWVIAGFAFGYAAMILREDLALLIAPKFFRFLIPFLIGIPVWARIIEYRRDQARENYYRQAVEDLMSPDDFP